MKSTLKKLLLVLLISCFAVTTALFVASCDKGNPPDTAHTQHVDSNSDGKCDVCGESMQDDNTGNNTPDGKLTYTVTLLRSSGDPLSRVTVVAYDDDETLVGFGTTDDNGVATFNAPAGEYAVMLAPSQVPAGYHIEDSYPISSQNPSITIKLAATVITDKAMPNNTTYELGSVMYDFSFTDSTGKSGTLAGLLSEKKMVLINFWYTTCTWCLYEFPDMKSAFAGYSDDVAILALDPMDTTSIVESFRTDEAQWGEGGLPFRMVGRENACTNDLASRFGVTGYPTSVLIDREGVVCFIADGAGTKEDFIYLFEKYTAEPYEQDIVFPGENAVEMPLPDVDAPSSAQIEAAINNTASGFSASYYFVPEGEEDSHIYNWPWVIGEDADGSYIHPSNAGLNGSYSIIYSDIVISEALPVIAFDYKVSCEALTGLNGYGDALYVYLDGTIICAISGISNTWQTCYAYVPLRAGTYNFSLAYVKDESNSDGDDTVYVKNMRFLSKNDIGERVEIYYQASSGPAVDQEGYTYYETPVYNENDGYYHVNSVNGPLLLADLMNYNTHWSDRSAYEYVMNGGFMMNGVDATSRFIDYCQYANNSRVYGLVAVTKELHDLLVALTEQYSTGAQNEWLELCSFYVVYGGEAGEIVLDPARGLADYNAFDAVLNTGTERDPDGVNHVDIDRILIPRGLWYKFVAQKAGVYRIMSIGDSDTYGWLYNENLRIVMESDDIDFNPDDFVGSNGNFCMTVFMAVGEVYYIAADYKYTGETGSFDFLITLIADEGDFWMPASSGFYTTETDENDDMLLETVYLAGAIEYRLGEDGLYHSVNADGSLGLPIYINLLGATSMFQSQSIAQMLSVEQYYCKSCGYLYFGTVAEFEADEFPICYSCFKAGKDAFAKCKAFELPTPVRDADGKVVTKQVVFEDTYLIVPEYEKDGNGNVIFTDYTEILRGYCERAATEYPVDGNGTEHYGYVAASEELVDILMKFIIFGDHSMSPNIPNAWLLLANYYLHLGPAA